MIAATNWLIRKEGMPIKPTVWMKMNKR